MATCSYCDNNFTSSGRRRYCCDACRQGAYRRRSRAPAPEPIRVPQQDTVYECPSCEARYLGVRRCPDCNQYCRRIGAGGLCPHCDEPVAHNDLEQ
jgi:hypothetical protein